MITKPVKIHVYYNTSDTETQRLCGKEATLDECETREITFYTISGVRNYKENDKFYGAVMSNGEDFITNLSYKALNELIQTHI